MEMKAPDSASNNAVSTVDTVLPAWARQNADGIIELDPALAYPHYIGLLKLEADKYGAEMARRCAIEDLKLICGSPLRIKILKRPDWALAVLPGSDADADRVVNEFGTHYDALTKRRAARAIGEGGL